MNLASPAEIGGLLRLSVSAPRDAAQRLMVLDLSQGDRWALLGLVAVLSSLLRAGADGGIVYVPTADPNVVLTLTPFAFLAVLGGSLVLLVFVLAWCGRAFGGKGSVGDFIPLIAWWEVMSIAFALLQAVVALVAPLLGGLVALASLGLLLWAIVNFVDEGHGFNSPLKGFGVLFTSIVGLIFGASVVIGLLFLMLPGA